MLWIVMILISVDLVEADVDLSKPERVRPYYGELVAIICSSVAFETVGPHGSENIVFDLGMALQGDISRPITHTKRIL